MLFVYNIGELIRTGIVTMAAPPQILQIGQAPASIRESLGDACFVVCDQAAHAADILRQQQFDAVIACPALAAEMIDRFRRDETILANVDQGIASVDIQGRVTWANVVFRHWCGRDPVGLTLIAALAPCTVASESANPLEVQSVQSNAFRIHQPPPSMTPYLDVNLRPVVSNDGTILHSVAIIQNVSGEVEQQKKLDALHQAGRDLASLDAENLAEMNIPTRIEMLKQNLLRYVHNLLHYETIEVRLLDPGGELMPLVSEGMTDQAKNRRLFRSEFGNGVTGHVAYTGRSFLCPDTSKEPLYLEGAKDAKSSLTIPLKYNDEVIGTLNVESPRVNGFGPEDLKFTELLSKELAAALHTLDLLSAQQTCTLSASIEAVSKEIALPVDEVLGSAALLYAKLHAADPEAGKALRRIMENARSVKDCVNKVHRSMSPAECVAVPENLAGKRVLVIEQLEQHRRTIHLMLRRLGVSVETVTDPLEGLALCTGTNYDAIFLEIKPLNMRGSEAFFKFRLAEPEARVSLTTGFGYDECHTKPTVANHGLTALLFKPFKIDQVTKAITSPLSPPLKEPITA